MSDGPAGAFRMTVASDPGHRAPAPLGVDETLSAEARDLLGRMLLSQAYRELGAVRLLDQALRFVLDSSGRERIAQQMEDEQRHLHGALTLWSSLTGMSHDRLFPQVEERLRRNPLPPLTGPLDLAMAQFVYDRAGYFQLREYQHSRFAPYARLVQGILSDEADHQDQGAADVRRMVHESSTDPTGPVKAQACFSRWLRVSLLSFGRPHSTASARAIELGFKARPPAAVMADFLADLQPTLQAAGLALPDRNSLTLDLPDDLPWPPATNPSSRF